MERSQRDPESSSPHPGGLPRYTTRVSRRAHRVHLKVSPDGLEVVVPQGFSSHRIPGILHEHRRWIDRAMARMSVTGGASASTDLPDRLNLQGIGEVWQVRCRSVDRPGVRLQEHPEGRTLVLSGGTGELAACRDALRRWLLRKGRKHLVPWLSRLGSEQGFEFGGVTIRCQRSRWGSCTRRTPARSTAVNRSDTISLNAKLLFLPPRLIRYVLLHELCHTAAHDHSDLFWRLLRHCEPETPALQTELRGAWTLVPGWLTRQTP